MFDDILSNPRKDILYLKIGIGFILTLALGAVGCVVGYTTAKEESVHAIESHLSQELVVTELANNERDFTCNNVVLQWTEYMSSYTIRPQVRNGSGELRLVEVRAGRPELVKADYPSAEIVYWGWLQPGESVAVEQTVRVAPWGVLSSLFNTDETFGNVESCARAVL